VTGAMEVLSGHLPGGTEETQDKTAYHVPRSRFSEYQESSLLGKGRPAFKADLTAICEPVV
jgi:hypothetical protein